PGCVVGEANRAPSLLLHMVSMRTRTPTSCGLVSLFSITYLVSSVSRRRFWPGATLPSGLLGSTSRLCVTRALLRVNEDCRPVRALPFLPGGSGWALACGAK